MEELLLELLDESVFQRIESIPEIREAGDRIDTLTAALRKTLDSTQSTLFEELHHLSFERKHEYSAYAFLYGLKTWI